MPKKKIHPNPHASYETFSPMARALLKDSWRSTRRSYITIGTLLLGVAASIVLGAIFSEFSWAWITVSAILAIGALRFFRNAARYGEALTWFEAPKLPDHLKL